MKPRDVTVSLDQRRIGVIGSNGSESRPSRGCSTARPAEQRSGAGARPRPGEAVEAAQAAGGFHLQQPDAQIVMPTVAEDVASQPRGGRGPPARDRGARVGRPRQVYGLSAHSMRRPTASPAARSSCSRSARSSSGSRASSSPTSPPRSSTPPTAGASPTISATIALPQQLVLVTHDLRMAARCVVLRFDVMVGSWSAAPPAKSSDATNGNTRDRAVPAGREPPSTERPPAPRCFAFTAITLAIAPRRTARGRLPRRAFSSSPAISSPGSG